MDKDINGNCYCCGCKRCIGTFAKIAMAEFEAQVRKGNKQTAPSIPRNAPIDETPFNVPYNEENLK